MNEPILVVMAAGIGHRFGGLKQMTPVGTAGESIVDFSLYDACRAGFKRVVFILREEILADFKRLIGDRWCARMEVRYALQRMDSLPEGFSVPEGREKPWGTAHAILSAGELIDAPFAAINADDYYGAHAYQVMYDMLTEKVSSDRARHCMVGYPLSNTVTPFGSVARGVCSIDENGCLQHIVERTHIISSCDGPLFTLDGETYTRLPEDTVVSLNLWGFEPSIIGELKKRFPVFLRKALADNPLKAEFFLPSVVCELIDEGLADVRVTPSPDRWYGVTHRADLASMQKVIRDMTESGLYPAGLGVY